MARLIAFAIEVAGFDIKIITLLFIINLGVMFAVLLVFYFHIFLCFLILLAALCIQCIDRQAMN